MKKNSQKIKKSVIDKLLIATIITTIIVTILSFSKYNATIAGNTNAKVAVPVITFEEKTAIFDITASPSMATKEYIFYVSNSGESLKTDTTMTYTIGVESLGNLPLEFELYTYENETCGDTNLFKSNGKITDKINMGLSEKITHPYILKISWSENQKSYKFSKVADYVQIVVNSEQVD